MCEETPVIDEHGRLVCIKTLANLFARRNVRIMQDTLNPDDFWIEHGRIIEPNTAKAFIQEARKAGIMKSGVGRTNLFRCHWHI